ncbi:MAG: hypothetical protein NWP83_03660, partial [Spirosomaceae bacterium]|nr:hypothetical protein [Spirosomataceae bacterium]
DEFQDEADKQQRTKLGNMVMAISTGILLMLFIPNPLWGRLLFVGCAICIFTLGYLLKRSASDSIRRQ